MKSLHLRVMYWALKAVYWLLPFFYYAIRIALFLGILVFGFILIVIIL